MAPKVKPKGPGIPKKDKEPSSSAETDREELDDDTENDTGSSSFSKESTKGLPEYATTAPPNGKKGVPSMVRVPTSRMLVLFRSGEQMNKIFPDWTHKNFIEGKYHPTDMNHPVNLVNRKTPQVAFESDPPLTEMGTKLSELSGRALAEAGIVVTSVYCSPSLHCVQTAHALLKAQLYDLSIRIEPALYDYMGHQKGQDVPMFMTPSELAENRIAVDKNYKPQMSVNSLKKYLQETPEEFFKRQSNAIYALTKQSPNGTILVVTHSFNMHAAGRSLVGRQAHTLAGADLLRVPFNYPYCSAIAFQPSPDGRWKVAPSAVPPLNFHHFSNRFNFHFFSR
uniref:Phosphoglycerate mutase family protein n=1 Tax=Panagrellus redivivus TaxID=6233 RepID=A0A7E4W8K3_PANRE